MLYQATRDDLLHAISAALFFKHSKELQKNDGNNFSTKLLHE